MWLDSSTSGYVISLRLRCSALLPAACLSKVVSSCMNRVFFSTSFHQKLAILFSSGWRFKVLVNLLLGFLQQQQQPCDKWGRSVTKFVWIWMNRHRCWVSRSATHRLWHFSFGCSLEAAASLSPSSMCVCTAPFFYWTLKKKMSSSFEYIRAQGASQRNLRLPDLSVPYGSFDRRFQHVPSSMFSSWPKCGKCGWKYLTFHRLHYSLCRRASHKPNNSKQQDQIQALNAGKRAGVSHMFAIQCVCMRARVCFEFGKVFILVFVLRRWAGRPDWLWCCGHNSTNPKCSVPLLTFGFQKHKNTLPNFTQLFLGRVMCHQSAEIHHIRAN